MTTQTNTTPFLVSYFWALLAACVAPSVGAIPWLALGTGSETRWGALNLGPVGAFSDLLLGIGGIMVVFGTLVALFVGIPLHFLYRRRRAHRLRNYVFGGIALGQLPMLLSLVAPLLILLPERVWAAPIWIVSLAAMGSVFAVSGAISGAVFWWITKARS